MYYQRVIQYFNDHPDSEATIEDIARNYGGIGTKLPYYIKAIKKAMAKLEVGLLPQPNVKTLYVGHKYYKM